MVEWKEFFVFLKTLSKSKTNTSNLQASYHLKERHLYEYFVICSWKYAEQIPVLQYAGTQISENLRQNFGEGHKLLYHCINPRFEILSSSILNNSVDGMVDLKIFKTSKLRAMFSWAGSFRISGLRGSILNNLESVAPRRWGERLYEVLKQRAGIWTSKDYC